MAGWGGSLADASTSITHGEAIGALTRSAHRYHRSTRKADGEGTSLGVIADGRSASFTAACPGAACG